MTDATADRDAVDDLVAAVVDEFRARQARGEHPDPEEYAERHPSAAAVIRKVLAAVRLVPAATPSGPADGPAAGWGRLGDFRLLREVGRGGMGVVYEAEQVSLGRRVAVKVLPLAATADPRRLDRFRHEARAAALLHHPHVVPVHAVGEDRGVHYIAMQFVDGRTVADLIAETYRRPTPADGAAPTGTFAADGTAPTAPVAAAATAATHRPADFFRTAARLCAEAAEALEHAHSLGVVHRDVKPGNLLLDGSGRVWVADFGLAKLGTDPGLTGTGDLLGTLRYMSPEQALAKHGLVDHRTDVYALGATLYELLTGRPAVDGADRQEVLKNIAFAEPVPPRRRDRRVPRDLETVVLKCLEKDPARRYQSAKELADDLRRWLEEKPIRARPPGSADRAARWIRRNRAVVMVVAATGLILFGVTAAGAGYFAQDRAAREQLATDALDRSEAGFTAGDWPRALAEARRAEAALADRGSAALQRRVSAWVRDLEMVARLEAIRLDPEWLSGNAPPTAVDGAYATAFREYGLDIDGLATGEAADRIRQKRTAAELAAALDHWTDFRRFELPRTNLPQVGSWEHLTAVARAADPDPVRSRLRDLLGREPKAAARELKKLADSPDAAKLSPATCVSLAVHLDRAGLTEEGVGVLLEGWRRKPGDLWVNINLGFLLGKAGRHEEAVRYASAAVAIRPDSQGVWISLGGVWWRSSEAAGGPEQGRRYGEAERCFREALRVAPDSHLAYSMLGAMLGNLNRYEEVEKYNREAARLKPDDGHYLQRVGDDLSRNGKLAEAEAFYRRAIAVSPDKYPFILHLGRFLERRKRPGEAEACYRELVRLRPGLAGPHYSLGVVLYQSRRFEEAEACFREDLRGTRDEKGAYGSSRSGVPAARWLLGSSLQAQGKLAEAEACFREIVRLLSENRHSYYKDLADAQVKLGQVLLVQGKPAAALQHYSDAFATDRDLIAAIHSHRYNAACAAALVGCGRGETEPHTSEGERARRRVQALGWLRAELAASTALAGNPAKLSQLRNELRHWQRDPDLSGVRDQAALAGLPAAERAEWQKLWAGVTNLLARTEQPTTPRNLERAPFPRPAKP